MSVSAMELGRLSGEETAEEAELRQFHAARASEIRTIRAYYEGSQWDAVNQSAEDACEGDDCTLPEHQKKLAYCTQIQECVDYIAAQLAEGFQVTADDAEVNRIVQGCLSGSPDLGSDDDENDLSIVNQLREAVLAGDVAVRVRWDPGAQLPWLEFWEAEAVDFRFDPENRFRLIEVRLMDTVWLYLNGSQVETPRVRVWHVNPETGECEVVTYLDGEYESAEGTGLPFIPWRMWRSQRKGLRKSRGASWVTSRIRSLADRYDAVEQLSFVITRYNSHGNLAVIGDGALISSTTDARVRKDVADVLTFPGGTAVEVITLPTDPQMIEHQRQVLLDSLYSAFGLTRLDATTIGGIGQVSGYALEILNRKTNGTFNQARTQLSRDIRSTLNLALDVYVHMVAPTPEVLDVEVGEEPVVLRDVDPDLEFSNRAMEIAMGTGYIVDTVMLRDDYTAKLLSREEVLRKRGYGKDEIAKIVDEIDEAEPPQPEVGLSQGAILAAARTTVPVEPTPPAGVWAGGTVGEAERG